MRTMLGTTRILVLAIVGCSPSASATADTQAIAVDSSVAARCEAIASEKGPCTLWGPSIIELIARPELYDGKRVRVIGFVNFEFEGNGLYLSRDDWQNAVYRNGLWINAPAAYETDSASSSRKPNRQYVLVEATFRAGRGGHFGMWSGSLEQVTRLDSWGSQPPPSLVPGGNDQ